jgi:hypothetical protein
VGPESPGFGVVVARTEGLELNCRNPIIKFIGRWSY